MAKFTITAEINSTTDKYWAILFNQTIITEIHLGALGFPEYHILEQRETDSEIIQKISITPDMSTMPGSMVKSLGSGYKFFEERKFDKQSKVLTWKRTPSTSAEMTRFEGTLRIQYISDSKIRSVADTTIESKVFGIGSLMESTFQKQYREYANALAVEINRVLTSS